MTFYNNYKLKNDTIKIVFTINSHNQTVIIDIQYNLNHIHFLIKKYLFVKILIQ